MTEWNRKLLFWFKNILSLNNLIICFLSLFYIYIFIPILCNTKWEKLQKGTKIKVSVHKMFCESVLLSGDVERG